MGNPVILCKDCSTATAVYSPPFTTTVLAWYVIKKKEEICAFTSKKKDAVQVRGARDDSSARHTAQRIQNKQRPRQK